jgi:2,4-dienoyl-CoA reductase-like NADH-dependent reductase (Old Yellow Enzyme family)
MTAFQPLQLPNGTTVFNRIAKAAMEENSLTQAKARPPSCCACIRPGPRAVPGCC